MSNFLRRVFLAVAVLQFLAPLTPQWGWGQTIGARAVAGGVPPELPLGLFFSIWGVIFLGYLALGVLANRRAEAVPDEVIAPIIFAGLGNVAWMLSAQLFGLAWLDLVLLVPIVIAIWEAALRFDGLPRPPGPVGNLLDFVIGLWSGWITVALAISIPKAVRSVLGLGATDHVWVSLWLALIPAVLLAWLYASRFSRSWWFFAAFFWGLGGVAANNWFRTETHALALVVVVAGLYVFRRRLRFGASGSSA